MPKAKYTKRADGRYVTSVSVNGKRKYIYGNTCDEVDRKIIELKHNKLNGIIYDDTNLTFKDWADSWLNTYKKDVSLATQDMYRNNLRLHVYPFIANVSIKNLRETQIMDLLNQTSGRSKEIALLSIKQILDKAVDNDLISKNVAKRIKIEKTKSQEKIPLSEQQIKIVHKASECDLRAFLILFLIYTGLRKEELVTLKYEDIDIDNKLIRINKAYNFKYKQIKETKNKEVRYVPILDIIINQLTLMKSEHKPNQLVFPDTTGGIRSDTSLKRLKEVMEKQFGFTFTFHQLRHTYVCLLYKAGIQPKQAQQWTGHKDIQVLLNIYTHLDSKDNEQAFSQLNNYILNNF